MSSNKVTQLMMRQMLKQMSIANNPQIGQASNVPFNEHVHESLKEDFEHLDEKQPNESFEAAKSSRIGSSVRRNQDKNGFAQTALEAQMMEESEEEEGQEEQAAQSVPYTRAAVHTNTQPN